MDTSIWQVYCASSYSPLHTETPANAASIRVNADDMIDAVGKANQSFHRIGIEMRDFKYVEIFKVVE